MGKATNVAKNKTTDIYGPFDQLNGEHPWMQKVPEGYVGYPARKLNKGDVAYFNFELAEEMGLIAKGHPHKMNKQLSKKILDTFSIRIINEYDQQNGLRVLERDMKENEFMATRYLQLQHKNKRGETSGDGRCIWNGVIQHRGTTWDVSSRGTGVTALAPGAVEAGRPLKSGSTDFGYGCGLAEIDELYSAALMAEIFHKNGMNTERMLTVVDLGGGVGIGVRAGKNLIRPAHLFVYLKQENYDALKRSTDYLIERQYNNKEWDFGPKSRSKYELMLKQITEMFAKFTAELDREYIFAWLDWDGDNVLANAGIIDYGSIRQFGLRHDQYRYDDVDRFSTTLNEQKGKARLIVQAFAQMIDYLTTKSKKPLQDFKHHPALKEFDHKFHHYLLDHFLYQVGFKKKYRQRLLEKHSPSVLNFYHVYSLLERVKTSKKEARVADGVNRPAIFNMRTMLRVLPKKLRESSPSFEDVLLEPEALFPSMLAEHANRTDSKLTPALEKRLLHLQECYKQLLLDASEGRPKAILKSVAKRSAVINRDDRVTGNALLNIVNEILKARKRGLSHHEVQKVMDEFITSQHLKPERKGAEGKGAHLRNQKSKKLHKTMLNLVQGHKEDI